MKALRHLFLAAVRSLLRGQHFILTVLASWFHPRALKASGPKSIPATVEDSKPRRSPHDFLEEVDALFRQPIQSGALRAFAFKLKAQFEEGLRSNPACMLPSYSHPLPSRSEHGQYLALDVGGSTLRVALVELRGWDAEGSESRIVRLDSFKIDREVKNLVGRSFFDWLAHKIVATVSSALEAENSADAPLLMGLAWSFPLDQTSHTGGKLQGMGKGFLASDGLVGHDLGALIAAACLARGLHAAPVAIVNDATAALLAAAYRDAAVRFGLVLGTGVNVAVHLPVPAVGRAKLGARPAAARHVVVNTELGMFGRGILPLTRWDAALNAAHLRPDFQPLEHLVSGCYLGEVCRLVLVEAIGTTGVFGGVVPPSLLLPYSLETDTLASIEADNSAALAAPRALFEALHPSPAAPTAADMAFLRTLAARVSRRSSALVAAALVALWQLQRAADAAAHAPPAAAGRMVAAVTGAVIERYPGYLRNCQGHIDELLGAASPPLSSSAAEGRETARISLVVARESSLIGAAVALACLEEGKANGAQAIGEYENGHCVAA